MADSYNAQQIAKQKTRVTYVGALVNVFLTSIKITFGILGQSAALIADGVHSLSDLLSDLIVIIAIKLGSREADYEHPYGHRRFETLATVLLGVGLIAIGGAIAWDVMNRMLYPETLLIPNVDALGIAVISILANEWLYHYTKRIAKRTRSKLLLANAWHHRSDAISSIVVLFGIIAVLLGYPFADAVAAVVVALMIAKIGLSLVLESIKELVDTSLPANVVADIRTAIIGIDGVEGIHLLRTRQMGEDAYIDAHIVVDPRITVSEGHMIGDVVRDDLIDRFDDVMDVLVHIDPENDEVKDERNKPLSRKQVEALLDQYFMDMKQEIENFRVHYLDGRVEVEIILPYALSGQPQLIEKLTQQCALMSQLENDIFKVIVFFKT